MGGHVTADQTTPLVFTKDNETWIIDLGVSVAVNEDPAVLSSNWANSILINHGTISASGSIAGIGNRGVVFGGDGGSITNSGQISSAYGHAIEIATGSGETTVVRNLQGGIIQSGDAAVLGGDGNEKIVNAGKIVTTIYSPTVDLGAGNDVFIDFLKVGTKVISGTVSGIIDLGDGDDILRGGNKAEGVQDRSGSDTYKLSGGSDHYYATHSGNDGNDIISGGSGVDSYDAFATVNDLQINLDNVAHTDVNTVAANTAQGNDISGGFVFKDTVTGFENAYGGEGHDQIFGNKAANFLNGYHGPDGLYGFGGNDHLVGGSGADTLVGGKGADVLDSGVYAAADGAADSFLFLSLKDSTAAKAGRDVINFFEDTLDIIKLDAVDANMTNGGATNEAFQFLGVDQPFASDPGDLRIMTKDYGWLIQADVNGDKKADFAIQVNDLTHTIIWSADDFVL